MSDLDLAQRMQIALDKAGVNWSKAAEKLGMTPQASTKWKKGQIKRETLEKFAKLTDVNFSWLITGIGDINNSTGFNTQGDNLNSGTQNTAPHTTNNYTSFYKDFSVACGHSTDNVAVAVELEHRRFKATIEQIGSHENKIFATVADNDSMSPTINEGDTIWIETSKETIKDGKIFVFEYGGLLMCKRLFRLPNNGLRVVSENSTAYP